MRARLTTAEQPRATREDSSRRPRRVPSHLRDETTPARGNPGSGFASEKQELTRRSSTRSSAFTTSTLKRLKRGSRPRPCRSAGCEGDREPVRREDETEDVARDQQEIPVQTACGGGSSHRGPSASGACTLDARVHASSRRTGETSGLGRAAGFSGFALLQRRERPRAPAREQGKAERKRDGVEKGRRCGRLFWRSEPRSPPRAPACGRRIRAVRRTDWVRPCTAPRASASSRTCTGAVRGTRREPGRASGTKGFPVVLDDAGVRRLPRPADSARRSRYRKKSTSSSRPLSATVISQLVQPGEWPGSPAR